MVNRSALVAWFTLVAACSYGCDGAPGQDCEVDEECPTGAHCVDGLCDLSCREDLDCIALGGGSTCSVRGRCVAGIPGQCVEDADCANDLFCDGDETCDPEAGDADPRGCVGGEPCAMTCDEDEEVCGAACDVRPDADGDGSRAIACGGPDCDDANPNVYPGAVEICDAADLDEDCDAVTFGRRDADGDNYTDARCCNQDDATLHCGTDCDDSQPAVHPTEAEDCDGLDNDCDGAVDEDVRVPLYPDFDRDLFGANVPPIQGCLGTPRYSLVSGDCDDANPMIHVGAVDGPPSACDMVDNDCNSSIDAGCGCTDGMGRPCGRADGMGGYLMRGVCTIGTQTCAGGTWGTCTANVGESTETACDGRDEDCDGAVDEAILQRYWPDADGDTYGEGAGELRCALPTGYVARGGDCNGAAMSVHANAPEVCNNVDDDCDMQTDDGYQCARGASPITCFSCGYVGSTSCTDTCTVGTACAGPQSLFSWDGASVYHGLGAGGGFCAGTGTVSGTEWSFTPTGSTTYPCRFAVMPDTVLPLGLYRFTVYWRLTGTVDSYSATMTVLWADPDGAGGGDQSRTDYVRPWPTSTYLEVTRTDCFPTAMTITLPMSLPPGASFVIERIEARRPGGYATSG